MSELWPDALFAVDGTELPVSGRDRSDHDRRGDAPLFPPSPLPSIPRFDTTREQIAATFDDDPGGSADRGSAAAPPTVPAPRAPQPSSPQLNTTAMQPAPAAPQAAGSTPAGMPTHQTRPVIVAAPSPAKPPPRGLGALRYRTRRAARSHPHVQRRRPGRAGRPTRGVQTRSRSNGGAGAFFLIMVITFAVLLYFIISGIVEAFVRLFG